MIVLDASIVVELLTDGELADSLRRDLAASSDSFIVPHLLVDHRITKVEDFNKGRCLEKRFPHKLLTTRGN
jgi:hypothetical protein